VGCDYAGIVEEVGPGVTKQFKKGDRICGPVNGSNGARPSDGTFARYIAVKGDLQIPTPDNLSDEEAATLGVAVTTVGQGLYTNLALPLPGQAAHETTTSSPPPAILINGGSTATGIWGIQYAKLSGYTVVATSSPRNFDYLRELGADHVFDYKSPTAPQDIRDVTGDKLRLAWDCQSGEEANVFCARCLSTTEPGVRIGTLTPGFTDSVRAANPNVESVNRTLYYDVFNEEYEMWGSHKPGPEEYEYAKGFWELSRQLLVDGKIKPPRIDLNRGGSGLEGVLKGLDDLWSGKVSAQKLVYTL
jgi:NADPH:quinone reductase-like Zn-dependent oxidoreductase